MEDKIKEIEERIQDLEERLRFNKERMERLWNYSCNSYPQSRFEKIEEEVSNIKIYLASEEVKKFMLSPASEK